MCLHNWFGYFHMRNFSQFPTFLYFFIFITLFSSSISIVFFCDSLRTLFSTLPTLTSCKTSSLLQLLNLAKEKKVKWCDRDFRHQRKLACNFHKLSIRLSWPVTEHLNAQDRLDPRGGFCCSDFETELEPCCWRIWCTKSCKK